MGSIVKKLKQKLNLKFESSSKKKEEELFLENGSIFLKKLIADCNGKSIPIRNFSSSQIFKATNNFDESCLVDSLLGWDREWYKGIIEDKPYLIKKFSILDDEDAFNDIVLSTRMSNHNNFLKLIGCCFEFHYPAVVFEYEELACLDCYGRIMVNENESKVLTWNVRLKIAKEVAIAITYLHIAFPRIIIHKNIMPMNILVDKNWKVKLTDFRYSVSVPEGKSRIKDEPTSATYGYIDPLYLASFSVSEYTDVYSFGVCLMVFLTGRQHDIGGDPRCMIDYVKGLYENEKFDELIDPMVAKDMTSGQRMQVEAFVVLALRSCEEREEDRPKMIQVAKELKRIERIEQSLNASSAIGFPKNEMLEGGEMYVQVDKEIKIQD